MLDLSIIVINFNTKKLVLDCLDSIVKEGSSLKKEVIVVDNGSTDGSPEALKELRTINSRLITIFNKKNLGYAKANNQGIKIAKGKHVLLLNSDTLIKKNALDALVDFAKKTPDAGVIGSRLYNADGTLQPSCFCFPTIKNAILEYWFGRKGLFEKFAPRGDKPETVDALVGASFLITPQARKKVGLLDERYWVYFEDIDYCRQVWKNGLKVYYLPSSEVIHSHGASFEQVAPDDASRWRMLIPSSKIYHGLFKHYLINTIIWLGQKWQKLLKF